MPAGFARMTKGIASRGYSTLPQSHVGSRVFWYTQAKVLDGGSTINAQVYTRGHPSDFDGWAAAGCAGWGYEDVLPYFRRSEDNGTFDDDVHGRGGPIGVSQPAAPLPVCEAFFAAANTGAPDIQLHLGLGFGIEAGITKLANAGVTLNTAYMRPKSRGTVRHQSSDVAAHPLIDPDFWAEPADVTASLEGLELARAIMRGKALEPFVLAERVPGPELRSRAGLIAYAHQSAKTDHPPASTCKMGVGADAVVTPDLKVRGLDGLRVYDGSIMPMIVSSNTNATAYMIAEKGAELIRRGGNW